MTNRFNMKSAICVLAVICIASLPLAAWAATECKGPEYSCAAGSMCCVEKTEASKPDVVGVCEKNCVGVLVKKEKTSSAASAVGLLQSNTGFGPGKKTFKGAGTLAIVKGMKELEITVAEFAAKQTPPLGPEYVQKFEAVQKAMALRSQEKGILLDNTMVSTGLRCLFRTDPKAKMDMTDKVKDPCVTFVLYYFNKDVDLINKKLVFWSGAGAQFMACEDGNLPTKPGFGVLEQTVFGKVLNLIAEQAGVKDWNSPIDSIILGNYFKVFDAASALYGHTVAKQVEQNGKATTVYIGTLPAPRAGKTCADAIDLFEKTIYVKTELPNMYAFGSKVTIEFKLASGGPLGGCFRKGAPLPAGVTEAQAAAAMAPTNCDTLQARLDTICALNDKCKGFQKANASPDPLKLQYTCSMVAYPRENGVPKPDAQYACNYPEFGHKATGANIDAKTALAYFTSPLRKNGKGIDILE